MAELNFNANTVPPSDSIEAIPAGWYNAQIDQSEMKPTKDGSGAYLELRFSVLDSQYANRKVFTRLNLRNANPVAQEIAYKQLSAICHATGVLQVQDSQQLHGRPMKIKVSVRAASGDYEASNELKAFKNIDEQVNGPVGAPAAQGGAPWAGQQAPAAQQAAPWAGAPAATPAPTQQFAPPVQAPEPAAAAPQWQPPAAQQPWAQAPQQQAPVQQEPVQQQAPQQAPAAQHPAQGATPPWMQQASAPAGETPPWAAPQQ